MSALKTSKDVRDFIGNMMRGVVDGKIDDAAARNLIGLAKALHESLYSEVKVARLQTELGRKAAEFGELPIGK